MVLVNPNCVIVMMRYPEIGKVKTRLATTVGDEIACEIYRNFILDTLDNLSNLDADVILAVDSWREEENSLNDVLKGYRILEQHGEDLGMKQFNAMREVIDMGYENVAVVISDGPDIDPDLIERSLEVLLENDSVIGPSEDGGYYLFGIRGEKLQLDILAGIDWDSENIHSLLAENLEVAGCSVIYLPCWPDVDNMEDFLSLVKRASINGRAKNSISFTRERLREVLPDGE